jgi:putative ABC transport system substrate-binding protein
VSADRVSESVELNAFLDGLNQAGWYEGQNLTIEWREAHGQVSDYPRLADDLIQLPVDVIVAQSIDSVRATVAATSKIPIVIFTGGTIAAGVTDPMTSGVAVNLAHPGGNVTGMFVPEPVAKRLELLKVALPNLTRVGMLHGQQANGRSNQLVSDSEAAAVNFGLDPVDMPVSSTSPAAQFSFEAAFQRAVAARAEAVAQTVEYSLFPAHAARIAGLALSAQLPSLFPTPDFVNAGALMSYGFDFRAGYQHLASFVDRVLRGADPGQLPIELPTRFYFAANAATAKRLGLTFPPEVAVQVTRWFS